MANVKFYTVTKEINGKAYTAQFNGLSAHLRMLDNCKNELGTLSAYQLHEQLLKNCVVEPKNLTPDDFQDMDELNEVVLFARKVSEGKFRKEADKAADPAKA